MTRTLVLTISVLFFTFTAAFVTDSFCNASSSTTVGIGYMAQNNVAKTPEELLSCVGDNFMNPKRYVVAVVQRDHVPDGTVRHSYMLSEFAKNLDFSMSKCLSRNWPDALFDATGIVNMPQIDSVSITMHHNPAHPYQKVHVFAHSLLTTHFQTDRVWYIYKDEHPSVRGLNNAVTQAHKELQKCIEEGTSCIQLHVTID